MRHPRRCRARQDARRGAGTPGRMLAGILAAFLVACGAVVGTQGPVRADPRIDVSVEGGTLNPDGDTRVDVSGSGFQSITGGFGGIYVLFGSVNDPASGSWRPSQGGITGEDYRYAFDDETNPVGYQLFVSFPGSSTEYAANGGEIAADGTWHATIIVPGAHFTAYDRQQNETPVDCTTSQCGILTIGAHGVKNANNESFTPVSFGAAAPTGGDTAPLGAQTAQTPQASQAPGGVGDTAVVDSAATAPRVLPQETPTTPAALPQPTSVGPRTSSVLLAVAAGILALALVLLAAGTGGYLASKALLLGVSPAALQREIGRRQRRADKVRHKEDIRRTRARRRAYRRLQKQETRTAHAALVAAVPSVHQQDLDPGAGQHHTTVVRRSRLGTRADIETGVGEPVDVTGTEVLSGAAVGAGLRGFFAKDLDRGGEDH